MLTPIAIIINDSAGSDTTAEVRARIAEAFHNLGAEAHFLIASSGEEIVDLARGAAAGDAGPVVAGGGDGTINAVASVLIETDRTLGVLPLGTLNHFAQGSQYSARPG